MKVICYENTKTDRTIFAEEVHETQIYGYAYETDTHFVHFYGGKPYYTISSGLTMIEKKNGSLIEWVKNKFGAINIQEMYLEAGQTIEGIWRPGLYYWDEINDGLKINKLEQISEQNTLRLLVNELDNLLLYVEPSEHGLECYSHKIRELLIISCTEVENQWHSLLEKAKCKPIRGQMYTTNDYIKLLKKAYLNEYSVVLRNNLYFKEICPFEKWDVNNPTKSLEWYDAYNKTKHNRDANFSSSKLKYVIESIAANIVLYSVRFSPLSLLESNNNFSSIINQMFTIKMKDADRRSFYIPLLDTSKIQREDFFVTDSYQDHLNIKWNVNKLIL